VKPALIAALTLTMAMATPPVARAATLDPQPCPFADDTASHRAVCSRFEREEGGVSIAFDVAVLTPATRRSTGHVVYIPGGPGEAPVSAGGVFADLLAPFDDRTVVLFNPRGTLNTEPRMTCDFGDLVWDEDFGDARAQDVLRGCVDRLDREGPDPALFTSLEIAEDIDAMLGALGIARSGLYGISYGTEAGLHLLAQAPRWLAFAILDSVSVPGVSGMVDELAARDRFLAEIDRACFAGRRCSALARDGAASLAEWVAQFDGTPLVFHLERGEAWSFDGTDMLDYLGQLAAYPDGLDFALALVEMLQTGRLRATGWISDDIASNTEFSAASLPLMLQAYSDTIDTGDVALLDRPTRYALNRESAAMQLDFMRLWHGARPREANFLEDGAGEAPVPVLVLSGGVDPFTPAEWARSLHARFTGLEHYVFPLLGHAVSVAPVQPVVDAEMTMQMRCAHGVVRAFLNPTLGAGDGCETYRSENGR